VFDPCNPAETSLSFSGKCCRPLLWSFLSNEATLLSDLSLKPSLKMTLIGTVKEEIIVDLVDAPEIIDDFELGQNRRVTKLTRSSAITTKNSNAPGCESYSL
jgi:hypothetical protein